jgi:hypothetical protein
MLQDKQVLERLKAAEPVGGYKDLPGVYYYTYFISSALLSIVVAYYLGDHLPAGVPPIALFLIPFVPCMIVGFLLLRKVARKSSKQ